MENISIEVVAEKIEERMDDTGGCVGYSVWTFDGEIIYLDGVEMESMVLFICNLRHFPSSCEKCRRARYHHVAHYHSPPRCRYPSPKTFLFPSFFSLYFLSFRL